MIKYLLIASAGFSGLILLDGCAFLVHGIKRSKNLAYVAPAAAVFDSLSHQLDIYAPAGKGKARPVLVFMHGGNWESGDKTQYKFLGNRLARKGILAVIINYRHAPGTLLGDGR